MFDRLFGILIFKYVKFDLTFLIFLGPDTGGTLKIYGESLCKDVPYKTLLLSVSDPAVFVVEEMLEKYGLDRKEAQAFCLIQMTSPPNVIMENGGHDVIDGREYYLEDDECPLAILMNHPPSRGTYHVGYAIDIKF